MSTRRAFLMQTAASSVLAMAGTRPARARDAGSPKSTLTKLSIPNSDLKVSRLGYGAGTGLIGWDKNPITKEDIAKAARLIHTAYDQGITLFDHADIYAHGKAEEVFGRVLKQSTGLRDKLVIQSKCGERFIDGGSNGATGLAEIIDLSREHIVSAVEGSLERLGTDRLDILLLHEADALVEPQEVAQAFEDLHRSGKVRYFGVSNYNASQIALLKKSVRQPLVINQLQLGLASASALTEGMRVALKTVKGGHKVDESIGLAGGGTIDYCRLSDIQVQAYSPLRGVLKPPADASPQLNATVQLVAELAQKKNTTPAVIALAWLLRHPAGIVPILGGDKPEYLIENCAADRLELSREEWYELFATLA